MAKKANTAKPEFKMGWLPDLPDARDLLYSAPLKVALKLPSKIDLRPGCPRVYNQGHLGSCTANALAGAFEFGKKKQRKAVFTPSRLFLYYNERVTIHTESSDSGAFLRDGIKSLNNDGICKETEWAYDDDNSVGAKFSKKPPVSCFTHAQQNQIVSYQRISNTNINSLKGCLADGFPFAFGFTVYNSFMTPPVAKKGIMPMPDFSKETVVGGHAILAVGYDEKRQLVLIRNSWGPSWGIKGYFWMPYAYITNTHLCDDFWTIRLVE